MKTITKEVKIDLYKFEELSEEVQEKIKQDYLDSKEACFFGDDCVETLSELFPNSELNVEFDFNCCQGSGLNICGDLYFMDILNAYKIQEIKTPFTYEEITILETISKTINTVSLKSNDEYTYSLIDRNDIAEQIICDYEDNFEDYEIPEKHELLIKKLDKEIKKMFDSLVEVFYKNGEKYFYEVEEDDIEDDEYFQGYFMNDGSRYYSIYIND